MNNIVNKNEKCSFFNNNNIIFTAIIEEEFKCKPYIIEQKCNEEMITL
jgi:hypothetical protein